MMAVSAGDPILLATRNRGKLRELEPIFAAARLRVVTLDDVGLTGELPEEDGLEQFATFEENALAKATFFHRRSGGLRTVADDSGLEVLALGGAPGVRSKRFAGSTASGAELDAANNAALLAALAGAPDRTARFVCAAAYVDAARTLVVRGETSGRLLDRAEGRGGFGYDPYFWSDELGATLATASIAEKERVSHRGRAFERLIAEVRNG
jgi:XTP/dITP diphosphohydrolase